MNDDLERQLARWRPADPPPDFLRRLRAAEPSPPAAGIRPIFAVFLRKGGGINWFGIAGGLVAALVVISVGWIVFSAPPVSTSAQRSHDLQVASTRPRKTSGSTYPDARPVGHDGETPTEVSLDLNHFVHSGLRYAVLETGPDAGFASRLPLDAPVGPMRLNFGHALPIRELGDASFSLFQSDARDQF